MFDGVYSGKRVLTKGSGPRCPAEDDVSVTIHGGILSFTNSVLQNFGVGFDPGQDGSFHMTYTGEGDTTVDMRGRISGKVIEADVNNFSTSCEYHWHLKKE